MGLQLLGWFSGSFLLFFSLGKRLVRIFFPFFSFLALSSSPFHKSDPYRVKCVELAS